MKLISKLTVLVFALALVAYCGKKSEGGSEGMDKSGGEEVMAKNTSMNNDENGAQPENAGEAAPGSTMTQAQAMAELAACKACHFLDKGAKNVKDGLGPGLKGIFNRKPVIAVPFEIWDAASLDKWLANPRGVNPRTRMTFKITDAEKRKQAVEALKAL